MKSVDAFAMGWLENSIGTLNAANPGFLGHWPFVLITSVDSETELRDSKVAKAMLTAYKGCDILGTALLLPGAAVSATAISLNIFTGFDEVWCFRERPAQGKPKELSIVAPLNLESEDAPPLLIPWMIDSRCSLGLGDGIGLNYVGAAAGLTALREYAALSMTGE